jgi:hypothetical protein
MPKQSGQDLKAVRVAQTRPLPPSRPIKRFSPAPSKLTAPPNPLMSSAPSNAVAAHAVRVASSPGKINPKQMHN